MEMIYNEERGTWNLFDGAEWYAEGTFVQMQEMLDNWNQAEWEKYNSPEPSDDYYGDDYYDDPWTNHDVNHREI